MSGPLPAPEFSRPIPAEPLPAEGRSIQIAADAGEREALAARFGVDRLDRLDGTVTLRPLGAKRGVVRVELSGTLEADVVQTCVVTLAPLPGTVTESVRLRFSSAAEAETDADAGAAVDIDPDADSDPPEPIVDGLIDVGEALAEAFGLALDPHPRAPDAALDGPVSAGPTEDPADGDEADRPSPFAALAALKTRTNNG
ncbi:YceD family protein [Roseospira navarrensis]|uniref:DUF177 domain-containing protein n=1 Tax=Roseospira navarrensis TaxID=140058 RepID=A0A7X1ZDK1_9PROT|nr:DUF177 domain-containing protein [Roseospira navarrensis]MQX35250.1 DUF177 domain-containing protein [Roseospira navarrensis]